MLLMIDNYDSFTYNLVHYFQVLGQETIVKRNDEIDLQSAIRLAPSYLVISPGPCTPKESGISLSLIEYFADKIPILGVCLGHQCIGQFFGGKVQKVTYPMHGKVSQIQHDNQGIFQRLNCHFQVARYHSLVLDQQSLPDCLTITAVDTTYQHIMGIQHNEFPIYGIQFHPEAIQTEYGYQLLNNFLQS